MPCYVYGKFYVSIFLEMSSEDDSSSYDMMDQFSMQEHQEEYPLPHHYYLKSVSEEERRDSFKFSSYIPLKIKENKAKHLEKIPDSILDTISNENIIQCAHMTEYVDLVIVCDEFAFLVSSCVVKNTIRYFEACLSSNWFQNLADSNKYSVYEMKGVDYKAKNLGKVLEWIHLGAIKFQDLCLDELMDIFKICQMFDLNDFLEMSGKFLVLKFLDSGFLKNNFTSPHQFIFP